jgi:large subunit ribosomal protein L10
MATREERNQILEALEDDFSKATGIYLTDFTGINVETINGLRAKLRKQGIHYKVVKNSIARIALERTGKNELAPFFKGPVGVAITEKDAIGPSRVLKEFHKEHKDILPLKGALVDGALFNAQQVEKLADIPSREVLLSQLLACLNAPMSKLVGSLSALPTKLVGLLEALKQKKEAESPQ